MNVNLSNLNQKKILTISMLCLAVFAFTTTATFAALTLNTTSIVSDGALTLTPATNVILNGNVGIGTTGPDSLLDMESAAPTLRLTDSTASAKSLLVKVDGNKAYLKEASNSTDASLLTLDLANNKVGVGTQGSSLSFTVPSFTFHAEKEITSNANGDSGIPFYFHTTKNLSSQDSFSGTFYGLTSEMNIRGARHTGRSAAITGIVAVQGSAQQDDVVGVLGAVENNEPGTAIAVTGKGFHGYVRAIDNNITNAYSYYAQNIADAGRTITNSAGYYAANPTNSGTITNNYGVYIENQTAGTNNYGIYVNGGTSQLGTDVYFNTTPTLRVAAGFSGAGELASGVYLGSQGSSSLSLIPSANAGTSGAKVQIGYYNGAAFYSALEIANVAGGGATRGNLLLMQGGGNVGIGTTSPNANAILDLSSTTKAFIPPRMTKVQRDAIASPAAGMTVYQTDNTPGLRVYNGTNWMRFTETAD